MVRPDKFELGEFRITPGAQAGVPPSEMTRALRRHASGDRGIVTPGDCRENDWAARRSERILSEYYTESGVKFWVITEGDRSAATVLLPEEC